MKPAAVNESSLVEESAESAAGLDTPLLCTGGGAAADPRASTARAPSATPAAELPALARASAVPELEPPGRLSAAKARPTDARREWRHLSAMAAACKIRTGGGTGRWVNQGRPRVRGNGNRKWAGGACFASGRRRWGLNHV